MTKNLPQNIVARVKMLKQPGIPLIPTWWTVQDVADGFIIEQHDVGTRESL